MPITVTFDIKNADQTELNRIRGFFDRLGWEHLGGTAYRYPNLHSKQPTEDWFNHVIPALMLLRTYARHAVDSGRRLDKFSIDVQSSTGYNPATRVGALPLHAQNITYSDPSVQGRAFGKKNLVEWIESITWPYP